MLATFSLRLAFGLAGSLLLLPAAIINPRFYRVHFLTILGLNALAAVTAQVPFSKWLWGLSAGAALIAFLGSILWSLDGAPGGKPMLWFSAVAQLAFLIAADSPAQATISVAIISPAMVSNAPLLMVDDVASAAVLGLATTAMLMGHSYLVAPTMSLSPLLRLIAALMLVLVARMVLAGIGLWSWTTHHSLVNLEDETVLWLPLRWGLGFIAPLILGAMAWQTAKIRSTQSATGILYVVVIFCFLGELTGQLLLRNTGSVL